VALMRFDAIGEPLTVEKGPLCKIRPAYRFTVGTLGIDPNLMCLTTRWTSHWH